MLWNSTHFYNNCNYTIIDNVIGQTPLHCAAHQGHADCMNILINSGAEVNAKNNEGDNISNSSLSLFVMN